MTSLWTRRFWTDALERAVRSFAQFALAFLTTDTLFNARTWATIGFATLYSLLMSVAGKGSPPGSASFLPGPKIPIPELDAEALARHIADFFTAHAQRALPAPAAQEAREIAAKPDVALREFQHRLWGKP